MSGREVILEIKNGAFGYDAGRELLHDINFTVGAREIVCVLGPNGAGKTTLLKCAMGLRKWVTGATYFKGTDIRRMRAKKFWSSVGYVPQAKLSSFVYTVRETVLLGRSAHLGEFAMPTRRDEQIAEGAMSIAGVSRMADKLCSRISGGEYQLVLIARALAAEPLLLVLDEPESNLDFKNQRRVLSVILRLRKERGVASLINTHYPEHAMEISDRTLLLSGGRSQFGATREIITEENLERVFDIPVHIEKFQYAGRERAAIVPLDDFNR